MGFLCFTCLKSCVESVHQTEPLPSRVPFPLIVNSSRFVNSSQWSAPPQALELVGAKIVPSSCKTRSIF
ncbi:hypothetical protein HanRHA438_Chr06g0262241 [Helianthus annuus]|nr:hypothetical protein HanRHA438_Chr06g0262241 [Helianthus annuus]